MNGKRYVFVEDLHAGEIGMDPEMGLLYPKGAIVDSLLAGMDELLISKGKILPENEWQQRQAGSRRQAETEGKAKSAPRNKRGRGAREDKAK